MSSIRRFLLIAILLTAGCAHTNQQPLTLRVLTYNIHHGEGTDDRVDLERIARVIRDSHADLVALQEVDRGVERSGGVDEPTKLGQLTGLRPIFEKNIDVQGGQYGNAILSRLPVDSHQNHFLPNVPPNEQRGLLEACVRVAGHPLVLFATHLDHQEDDAERLACVDYIRRLMNERRNVPAILAGDFNASPDSPVLTGFLSHLTDTCPPGLPDALTFPAGRPDHRIDYILYSMNPYLHPAGYQILPEPIASDHRPVLATFLLAPGPAAEKKSTTQTAPATSPPAASVASPTTRPANRITIDRIAPAQGPGLPDNLQRIDYTSTADGFKDWALVLPSNEPTWIVMIHGHGSTGDQLFTRPDLRDNWLPIFRGRFGILTVNLRGNAWMSPAAAADLHALLAEVRARYNPRRFILASASMGGTSNILYAVLHPKDIAGVVALCPATDLTTYHRWCTEHHQPAVIDEIRGAIEAAYDGPPDRHPDVYREHSAVVRSNRLTMPVYVVHGSSDELIPVTLSQTLAKAVGPRDNFRYEEVPGGHDAPHAYMQKALDWVLQRIPQ